MNEKEITNEDIDIVDLRERLTKIDEMIRELDRAVDNFKKRQ
jgi:hypothetical protein